MHHINLAEVRLPGDAVPGTACVTETVVYRAYLRRVLVHAWNRRAAVSGSSYQRSCIAGRLQSWITAHLLKCFILQTSLRCLFASSPRPHTIISTTAKRAVREVRLCVLPLRLLGRHGPPTLLLSAASGSNGRVPPPRGSSSPAPLGHPFLPPPLAVPLFSSARRLLMPRGAACGSALPVGPLSLLLSVFGGSRTCFPDRDCRPLQRFHCFWLRSCPFVPLSLCLPGRSDLFPGRVHVPLGAVGWQGPQVHCVCGNGSHLALTSLTRGVVQVVSMSSLILGVVGFPLEEQSMRLTIINKLIEPPFRLACSSLVPERGGQVQGLLRSLGLSSFIGSPREPIVVKFQDHPRWSARQPRWRLVEQLQGLRCGSTRPQAFNEAVSRPHAVVDSSTALAF